ncbi:hypothetical protein FQR65_LT17333 [Abscondita terminalis]|nr:hypothetical protein FQR65_LT17333 [Abscondita terminalis]
MLDVVPLFPNPKSPLYFTRPSTATFGVMNEYSRQTHFQYARKALDAGKNVIVEKPFTVNTCEAEELAKLADKKGLFLSVYQNRRFDRDFLKVKSILSEGILGNIKEAEIRFDRFRTTASGKEHKENPGLPASGALQLGASS